MPFLGFIHLWKPRQEFHEQIFQIEGTHGLQWDKQPASRVIKTQRRAVALRSEQ